MGARKLTRNVYGTDGVLYGPDGVQKVPADIAEGFTNPKLYEGSSDSDGDDEGTAPAEFPEGDPSSEWTAKQLIAWAGAHTVELDGATSKKDVVAKLGLDQS